MKKQITNKEIRVWALVFTALFAIIGTVQLLVWHHQRAAMIFYTLAAIILVPGTLFPAVMKPVYKGWMVIAVGLAWFNTRLILSLVYFLVFAPIGLFLRLFRVDLIKERWDKNATTYWISRADEAFDRERYTKQF